MTRIITAELLERHRACSEQVALFRELFPKGSPRTRKAAMAAATRHADKFDWGWAAKFLLPAAALRAYQEARAPAWRAYEEAIAPARRAYEEAIAPARRDYDYAVAAARVYQEATAPAWRAYQEARAPALRAYKEAKAAALRAYEEAKAAAFVDAWFDREN